jgi:VIT1/CCC1 family predicted Fe2+/Mn2+ transporter
MFMLQIIQPGLAGLMDGSVSTLAPIFAAAFATHQTRDAFLVGIAASLGAGISMAFAEALSDDGSLTGRGRPITRGLVTGLMTAAGGLGHTLPFLIQNFHVAFAAAVIVVAIELAIISWVRHQYMDTPLLSSAFQVVVGGVLVFADKPGYLHHPRTATVDPDKPGQDGEKRLNGPRQTCRTRQDGVRCFPVRYRV